MSVDPVLPGPILAVVAAALVVARLVTLRQVFVATGAQRRAAALRWSGLTLAVLLVLAALARPGAGTVEADSAAAAPASGPNVFFVVDRSVDSGVADYGGRPRIEGMRTDIEALIERYPQARFAMISFAARPSLDWPLSDDAWSLEPVAAALTPYADPPDAAAQVNVAAAANPLRYQLIQAGQQYPQSRNLVFYLGSGAGGSEAPQGRFELETGMVDGGAVLGYGTPGPDGGAPLDEAALQQVADQLGVPYARRDAGPPLESVLPAPSSADTENAQNTPRTEWYWLFMLLAAALALAEIYLMVRELRRHRAARRAVTS
ncbi:VWA domain-containing protein [Mycobacterium sp. NPDC050041]|uniref:VWA domain-containing protein n=1 Tax=Mycobacterium sp. NPDC050041 TaxID=3364293 RepID=UPI003C304A83